MGAPRGVVSVALDGLAFAEGPRWHQGRLWFSDMHAREIVAFEPTGRSVEIVAAVPGRPSGLGWDRQGRLLAVSMADRTLRRLEAEELRVVADLTPLTGGDCNDMVVDGSGRAYIGNFGADLFGGDLPAPATMVLVDADGTARVVAEGLDFPNGCVVTPDLRTLIVAESMGHCLTAFDVEDDGTLDRRRRFADLGRRMPDGICMDAAGAIWVACPVDGVVLRVREGGAVLDVVETTQMPVACALGGNDRRTLFVCTSATLDPLQCTQLRPSRIETVEVEVAGAGWP